MARRSNVASTMIRISRDLERQRREQERQRVAAVRAHDRAVKAADRAAKAAEGESRRLYAEARLEEAAAEQADLVARLEELRGVLAATLAVDDFIDPRSLKEAWNPAPFDAGPLARAHPQPDPSTYLRAELTGIAKFAPGAKAKHREAVVEAQRNFEADYEEWRSLEARRSQQLEAAKRAYEAELAAECERVAEQHAEIDRFTASLLDADPETVKEYVGMVLEASVWPDGFPQQFVLAFDASSKLLGVDYVLPALDVVPTVRSYKYTKSKDEITTTAETDTNRRTLYKAVVTQSALRILHEIFESDRFSLIETVALNCFVNTLDPATGQRIQPCILSVRTTRESFLQISLAQVDSEACLKGLAAAVSPKPAELVPVRPVVELRMIDPRFVEEQDVLSDLDQRPNLMELSYTEFENLITNLFMKMGLESRQTQASRDGGVDCVAYDPRPIFGGKVVIQAKRYRNTVGVASVRDLYGTVQNEGASKGILVTTSGYGQASYDFAKGKPLELLSGANLLYLLEEYAGVKAKITTPADWKEPDIDVSADESRTAKPPLDPAEPGTNPQHMPFPQPSSGKS